MITCSSCQDPHDCTLIVGVMNSGKMFGPICHRWFEGQEVHVRILDNEDQHIEGVNPRGI